MCGCMLSYQCQRPCRLCWISNEKCNDPTARSEGRLEDDMRIAVTQLLDGFDNGAVSKGQRDALLKSMSAKPVRVGFWGAPFGSPQGIYGATPPELLHQYDLGLCKKAWEMIMAMMKSESDHGLTPGITFQAKMELLDDRVKRIQVRHSAENISRVRFPNGVSNISYMRAHEYPSLMLLIALALGTAANDETLLTNRKRKQVVHVLMLLVALRRKLWAKTITAADLNQLEEQIQM